MKFLKISGILLSLWALSVSGHNASDVNVVLFSNCDLTDYYAGLSGNATSWSRSDLQALLNRTDRNILPVTGANKGDDDIYYALMDLDRAGELGKVQLVYRDIAMDDTPFADPLYWSIERLWSPYRGTDLPSRAFTDVHHLKPADSTVLLKKDGKIFNYGMCGTVESRDACVEPATDETAPGSAQDGKIWQPPPASRGEIARALLYMDLRYDGLELRDCGPFENSIGYLSQMLKWHAEYPPNAEEVRRSHQACARWQGNRNPFVDYPELAKALHGDPQDIISGERTYPSCVEIPTSAPTASPNHCVDMGRGNVPFFLVDTEDPDLIILLPMYDIPGGLELFLTDQAWNGTHLLEGDLKNEGTIMVRDG